MKLNQLLSKYEDLEQNDIILLLEKVLKTKYSKLLIMDSINLNPEQETEFVGYIKRLNQNEPVQYILGTWDFVDITLKVNERALIPRPETEILALKTVELAKKFDDPKIIDIGCGTGCIGLYLKHMLPSADVTLCDISENAISLATENAQLLDLDVNFLLEDIKKVEGEYDIIVSNPPYIPDEDILELDKSVIDYEPKNALAGGPDGLDFYRILALMHKNLNDCGYLAVEFGINQANDIKKILEKNFEEIIIKKDFAGIERMITAKKKS